MWRSTERHASTASTTATSATPSSTRFVGCALEQGDSEPRRTLRLGPDRAGNLLEIVVLELDDGSRLAIHAMRMRTSYNDLLP